MLVGLIRSTSASRVHEESSDYGTECLEWPQCIPIAITSRITITS